jgi:hypothetical protein
LYVQQVLRVQALPKYCLWLHLAGRVLDMSAMCSCEALTEYARTALGSSVVLQSVGVEIVGSQTDRLHI